MFCSNPEKCSGSRQFYDNMFVYFKPRGVWYTDIPPPWAFEIGKMPRIGGPLTKEMIIGTSNASQNKHKKEI